MWPVALIIGPATACQLSDEQLSSNDGSQEASTPLQLVLQQDEKSKLNEDCRRSWLTLQASVLETQLIKR